METHFSEVITSRILEIKILYIQLVYTWFTNVLWKGLLSAFNCQKKKLDSEYIST